MKNKTTHRAPQTKRAIRPPSTKTIKGFLKVTGERIGEQVGNLMASRPRDTVSAIKADHEALRNFIDTLKDADKSMTERKRAYAQFSALLKSHTSAEETAVYTKAFRLTGHKMHVKVTEGYVEHKVADDLMRHIDRTKNPLEWTAHVNVLAESVEHHLKEEEDDLLPLIRKESSAKLDEKMLTEYLSLRDKTQSKRTKKNSGVLKRH